METRIHNVSNLYNYINNSRQMENLDRQIAQKEEELELLEQLEGTYGKLGVAALFGSVEKYNKLKREILKLQLVRNSVEREILWFELGTLEED